MAEESEFDKTEEPTQKRLDDALKRGDVVKSQEVNTWFVIAGATLVLMAFSGPMSRDLTATMRGIIANSYNISVDGPALPRLFQKIGGEMVAAVAIPFLQRSAAISSSTALYGPIRLSRQNCRRFLRSRASSASSPSKPWPIR